MTESNIGIIKKHRLWRFLEIIPGSVTWAALILPFILSFFFPTVVASFIIIYTLTWLFRSLKLSLNLYRSYKLTQKSLITDWNKFITFNDYPEKIDYEISRLNKEEHPAEYFELIHLRKQIDHLKKINQYKKSKEIIQAVIFVTYKESFEVIHESVKSYTESFFDSSKVILVLAGEESDKENFTKIAHQIKAEFGHKLMHIIITIHPRGLPGEIPGKSSNATWAAKELKKYLDEKNLSYENVLISNFDADTVTHPSYFSELTFKYLTTEERTEKGYQPTHMFHNNIWDVPVLIRMVALTCTFWRMAESMEKDKYKSFSSRSMSFKTAVDTDFWDPAVIPEDSRQYWTAYSVYDGRHSLISIYSPVYMDAVLSDTYIKTFQSQYSQLRRWAWGVCDFPFVVLNLWYHPKIKLSTKLYHIFNMIENNFFWATGPILITFAGFIPGLVNVNFRDTVLAYNLPRIMSDILTLTSVGVIVCTIIGFKIVPYNPKRKFLGQLSLCLQWLFIPVVSIFLSAIPALDAQTRLIFGKYLEYKVTQKSRK